jgi:hypothetical protein
VPEKDCTVTVVDCYGVRRSIQVKAKSTYWAACHYFTRTRANPSDKLPQVHDGTIYEVQIIGDPKVYRVKHAKMLEWANRQGSKSR